MATIAKLVIEGIFDPDGVKKGMVKALSDVERFKKAVGNNAANLKIKYPDLAEGLDVQKAVSKLTRKLNTELAMAREAMFLGTMKPAEAAKASQEAIKEFNTGILNKIESIDKSKLTADLYVALVSQLRDAGLNAGKAAKESIQKQFKASPLFGDLSTQGQQAANSLLIGLNKQFAARKAQLNEQLNRGVITPELYKKAGVTAANLFDKGLREGMDSLRARGLVSPDIETGLAQKFKNIGLTATAQVQRAVRASPMFGDLSTQGQQAANSLVLSLKQTYDRRISQLRERFAAGLITPEVYKRAGTTAANLFDQGITAGISSLRAQGLLTSNIQKGLTDQFKTLGIRASASVKSAVAKHPLFGDMSAQGATAAAQLLDGLNNTFNKRINRLRENFANRTISVHDFRRGGEAASNAFDTALRDGLGKLRAQNLISSEVEEKLIENFKLYGLKSANAFQLAVDHQLSSNMARTGAMFTRALTVPIGAAGLAVLKLGKDFELAMKSVEVRLQPTQKQMEALTAQARELGSTSQFSASDAAQAQVRLASQAFDTTEILTIMPQVVNVAAASLTDMATAAELSGRVMRGFGLTASQLTEAMDVLVETSLKGQSLEKVAQAFIIAGPAARQAGMDFREVAAGIAILGQAGLVGERGGTAFRNIITRLQKASDPATKAGKAMKALGIEIVGADGRLKSFVEILKQFEIAQNRATKDSNKFNNLLNTIFETRTKTGFAVQLTAGAENFEKFRQAAEQAGGTAKRVGDVQMAGMTGALRELENVLQELALAIADSGLLRAMTSLVRSVADVILGFSALPPAVLETVVKFAALLAVLGPILYTMGKIGIAISLVRNASILMNGALLSTAASLAPGGVVLLAIAALGLALLKMSGDAQRATQAMEKFKESVGAKNIEQLKQMKSQLQGQIAVAKNMAKFAKEAYKATPRQGGRIGGLPSSTAGSEIVEAELQRVRDLEAQLNVVDKQLKYLESVPALQPVTKETIDPLKLAADLLGDFDFDNMFGGSAADAEKVKTALEKVNESTKLLLGLLDVVEGKYKRLPGLAEELEAVYIAVNTLLKAEGDQLTENRLSLLALKRDLEKAFRETGVVAVAVDPKELQEALDKLTASKPLEVKLTPTFVMPRTTIDDALRRFERNIAPALEAKTDLDLIKLFGSKDDIEKATKTYNKILVDAIKAQQEFAKIVATSNLPLSTKRELLARINEEMSKLTETKPKRGINETVEIINEIVTAARGINAMARSMDLFSVKTNEAIDHVLDLITAVGTLVAGIMSGDLSKILSGGVGTVGAVLQLAGIGESPAEKEAKRLQQQNNDRLTELNQTMKGFKNTLGNYSRVQTALQDAALIQFANNARGERGTFGDKELENLHKQLAKYGLTYADVAQVAKEFGITLRDSAGNLVGGAFERLRDAIMSGARQLIMFASTLEGVRSKEELRRNIFNLDESPISKINFELDLLEQFAPILAETFKGIDVSTREGRERLQRSLENLFLMIESNLLDPKAFGGLENLDQLIEIIRGLADGLDDLKEKAFEFGTTLDAVRAKENLRNRLFEVEDSPAATISSELKLLEMFAPALSQLFAGIDVATEQGREQLRLALQNLFTMLESGLLDPSMFGGLENMDDLLSIITAVVDAMDEMKDKVEEVNGALTNVPAGFKVERLRFASQMGEVLTTVRKALTPGEGTIPYTVNPPVTLPEPAAVPPTINNTTTVTFGDIVIQGTDMDGAQLYTEFKAEATKRVRARFGKTTLLETVLP